MTPLETVEALRSLGAYHVLVIDGDKRIEAQFTPSLPEPVRTAPTGLWDSDGDEDDGVDPHMAAEAARINRQRGAHSGLVPVDLKKLYAEKQKDKPHGK